MEQIPLISSGCFDSMAKGIYRTYAPEFWGTLWCSLFLVGISSQVLMAEFKSWKLSKVQMQL